jgi:hypothetical protein
MSAMKLSRVLARISGSLLAAGVSAALLSALAQQPHPVADLTLIETPDPVVALIEEHGCWRQDDPTPADMAGKFPTHAIVNGEYVGKRLTDLAFDQEIGGHNHGLAVSAFCR